LAEILHEFVTTSVEALANNLYVKWVRVINVEVGVLDIGDVRATLP
jgi:hypothetical protein